MQENPSVKLDVMLLEVEGLMVSPSQRVCEVPTEELTVFPEERDPGPFKATKHTDRKKRLERTKARERDITEALGSMTMRFTRRVRHFQIHSECIV